MMDEKTIALARDYLKKYRKPDGTPAAYRDGGRVAALVTYFDWMEKKIADDAVQDVRAVDKLGELAATYELNNRLYNAMLAKHSGCIEDLWHRVRKIEIAISNKETV